MQYELSAQTTTAISYKRVGHSRDRWEHTYAHLLQALRKDAQPSDTVTWFCCLKTCWMTIKSVLGYTLPKGCRLNMIMQIISILLKQDTMKMLNKLLYLTICSSWLLNWVLHNAQIINHTQEKENKNSKLKSIPQGKAGLLANIVVNNSYHTLYLDWLLY